MLVANINRGQAEAASFVALAECNADVITVAELTPEAVERFRVAGIDTVFRHAHLMPAQLPAESGSGAVIRCACCRCRVPTEC